MKDFIPWNQLQPPRVVWAGPEDTVADVRKRLRELPAHGPFNVPILIRLPGRHIAPTDARMLRKLAQKEGATILQRPLGELLDALCPQPWTVESRGPDDPAASQVAAARRLPVIVVQNGQRTGLMLPASHQAIDLAFGQDRFDLFDEPLSRTTLATEFITADLDTPLAQITDGLNSLSDPRRAHIVVVDQAGKAFAAISSHSLNQAALAAGPDVRTTPLRAFASSLRPAESRELGALGREQALYLAAEYGYLVLTEQGRPVGLLASGSLGRRSPAAPAAASEPRAAPPRPEVTLPGKAHEPRFVNLWFEDAQHQRIARSRPLIVTGAPYYLALNVGRLLARSIIDWERAPGGPQAIIEPQAAAYLYISLFSEDFDIAEPTQALWLPRESDSETLFFEIRPLHPSWGATPARLEVCLYYRTYLVQTFDVQVQVVAPGEKGRRTRPQRAELSHARTTSFPDMAELPIRALSLTINREGPTHYRLTFLVDPDPQARDVAQEAIRLSCRVRLSRDDLSHMITKARRQLYNIVRSFDRLSGSDERVYYEKATRALAQVGRQLYLKLFETDSARALRDWMEDNLPADATIQVVDLAGDFVFPWSLIYTAPPWDSHKPVEVDRFWGWRYKLAILTAEMLDTYRQAPPEIAVTAPWRISVGLYERLQGAGAQKEFFRALGAQTEPPLEAEVVNNRREMRRALTQADRDAYYFFCHGYTERLATDIQLDADLVSLFGRLVGEGAVDSRSVRDHLEDLFDVSDSWLRLTRGKIPLTMLKEMVPGRLARHPLVFLNMCQSAQVLPSLSDGFVPFFIRRGARAVIGTECTMNAAFADEFARSFWLCFLAGRTAGDALLALRRHYLRQGNPLALAYTLYGDADLRLGRSLLPADRGGQHSPCAQFSRWTEDASSSPLGSREARWAAVESLWADDLDGLMLTLAARLRANETGTATDELRMWNPPEEAFALEGEASPEWTTEMLALAQRWWEQLRPKLFDLLCKPGPERDKLIEALQEGAKMLAFALAPTLVAQVTVLPAVAIVIATIAAKKIAEAGLEAACKIWQEPEDAPA